MMCNGRVTIRVQHPDRFRLRELLPGALADEIDRIGHGHLAAVSEAVSRIIELPSSLVCGITIGDDQAVHLEARIWLLGPEEVTNEFHTVIRRLAEVTRGICPDCGLPRYGINACRACGWFIDYGDDGYLRF